MCETWTAGVASWISAVRDVAGLEAVGLGELEQRLLRLAGRLTEIALS